MKKDPYQIMIEFLDAYLQDVHTSIPGEIISYDAALRKATVKPLVKMKHWDGSDAEHQNITNVPVIFPSCGNFALLFPLQQGDSLLLCFSENGIGKYLKSGTLSNADTLNRFSLNDCVALPGLHSFAKVSKPSNYIEYTDQGALDIVTSKGSVKIDAAGNVVMNDGTEAFIKGTFFISALQPVIAQLASLITAPASTPLTRGDLTGVQSAATTLLTLLEQCKSTRIKGL